uniref:Uncharacterized protein n=1 Tax=Romanomermis culicivorax TaxID=13658 RepID=A0A915HW33_ROMCU
MIGKLTNGKFEITEINVIFDILTSIILIISFSSIVPLPSMSYIRNAHSSFFSGVPLDVTFMAKRNSLKSMQPELSVSNVRKTCSQKPSAEPDGKKSL